MERIPVILIQIAVLIFAVIVHEICHGYVAYKLGDPTAKNAGRLTFNPLPHIDPFMSILLPAFLIFSGAPFIIGGAKPVPVNPAYFADHRKGMMMVSAAGSGSNFALAAISIGLLKLVAGIPALISPGLVYILQYMIIINVVLAVFNLLPIPPLDGSKILTGFLPDRAVYTYQKIEPYGMWIIIILLMFGILRMILMPVFYLLQQIMNFIM
ncbi:MAG TPA: site-2 protease family protein [Firmicutes bacterium]|nr:site-2 protease family protein [Bacillota bacterium]